MFRTTAPLVSLCLIATASFAQNPSPTTDKDKEIAALKRQIGSLHNQVKGLRSELGAQTAARDALQQQLADVQRQVAALGRAVKGLQSNSILDLNGYLTLDTSNGYPTALFRGINVQVVNGTGNTQTANGLGNLIVGYNKPRTGAPICSLGYFLNQSECVAQGGVWAGNHKSGSHNIVGGDFNAYSMWGGVVVGMENAVNAPYATVTAGSSNVASGDLSTISGGSFNAANAMYGSVGGGLSNTAAAPFSSVSGGSTRKAERTYNWKGGSLSQDQ